MSQYDGKDPKFAFGRYDGKKLAAHITEHMGIKIPGNVADGHETEDAEA